MINEEKKFEVFLNVRLEDIKQDDSNFKLKIENKISLNKGVKTNMALLNFFLIELRIQFLKTSYNAFKKFNHDKSGISFKSYIDSLDELALKKFDKELMSGGLDE